MVFHLRYQNRISCFQDTPTIGIRDQINGLAGILSENDFPLAFGIQKAADNLSRALIGRRGAFRKVIGPAMHIGIAFLKRRTHRLNHRPGLLRRCATVQIDQRFTMDGLAEDREIRANSLDIIGQVICQSDCGVVHTKSPSNRWASASRKTSRIAGRAICSTASIRKDCVNKARA